MESHGAKASPVRVKIKDVARLVSMVAAARALSFYKSDGDFWSAHNNILSLGKIKKNLKK